MLDSMELPPHEFEYAVPNVGIMVDMAWPEARLCLEVDGPDHFMPGIVPRVSAGGAPGTVATSVVASSPATSDAASAVATAVATTAATLGPTAALGEGSAFHVLRPLSTHGAFPTGARLLHPVQRTMSTGYRRRLLEGEGWRVVSLPFHAWQRPRGTSGEAAVRRALLEERVGVLLRRSKSGSV